MCIRDRAAHATQEGVDPRPDTGTDAHIVKPLKAQMLAQTIGEVIESKGSVADPQVVAND